MKKEVYPEVVRIRVSTFKKIIDDLDTAINLHYYLAKEYNQKTTEQYYPLTYTDIEGELISILGKKYKKEPFSIGFYADEPSKLKIKLDGEFHYVAMQKGLVALGIYWDEPDFDFSNLSEIVYTDASKDISADKSLFRSCW